MSLRRISVEISKTINTGNFNSLRVQAGMEVDMSAYMSPEDAYEELHELVTKNLTTIINKELGVNSEEKEIKKPSSSSRWRTPTVPE